MHKFYMYPLELGSTTLHFDWMWFSIIFSVEKRSFLDEGQGLHLSLCLKTNIWNIARDYAGIVKWWL